MTAEPVSGQCVGVWRNVVRSVTLAVALHAGAAGLSVCGALAQDEPTRAEPPEAPLPVAAAPLRVGRIEIRQSDIYAADEIAGAGLPLRWLRRGMNALHVATRQRIIRRELLVSPGAPLDTACLRETERNLRELGFLTEVAIVPVDTLPDGSVDLEVRTQEVWSLRTQFTYGRDAGAQQRWSVVLSDRNFLGEGVRLRGGLGQDETRDFRLLGYNSRRVLGLPWQVESQYADQSDGHTVLLKVERPFYRQDAPWGLEVSFFEAEYEARYYLSNAGPAGSDPARDRSLHTQIPRFESRLRGLWLRRVAGRDSGRIWRLGGGLELQRGEYRVPRPELVLSDGRRIAGDFLLADGTPLRREIGTRLIPLVTLETTGRTWITARYLLQYGPLEDVSLDPYLVATGRFAHETEYGDNSARLRLVALDWSRLGGGLLFARAEAEAASASRYSPWAKSELVVGWMREHPGARQTRLFAEVGWGHRLDGADAFQLGLGRGLRSLEYDEMAGDRLLRWTIEHTARLPGELAGFYQAGLAAFYAGGAAWWRDEERGLARARHEAGVGVRLGSARAARLEVIRLDVVWPLDGGGAAFTAVTGGYF